MAPGACCIAKSLWFSFLRSVYRYFVFRLVFRNTWDRVIAMYFKDVTTSDSNRFRCVADALADLKVTVVCKYTV